MEGIALAVLAFPVPLSPTVACLSLLVTHRKPPQTPAASLSASAPIFPRKALPSSTSRAPAAFVRLSGVVGGRASLIESILADSALRVDELGTKAWTADVVFHRLDNKTKQGTGKQNKA